MAKPHLFSSIKSAVILLCLTTSQPAYAQSLKNSIVDLTVGSWTHEQKMYVRGQEIPASRLGGTQCVSNTDAHLTVGQYLQKFLQNVGEDVACSLSQPRGDLGNITVDVQCSNTQATTSMTLNYKYSKETASILGEGHIQSGGTNMPIRVVASSTYNGPC